MELKGTKVTVVGLARSGIGAANLLAAAGGDITVTDVKTKDELRDSLQMLASSIHLELGGHPDDIFTSADMIVVSPGVPLDIKPIASARTRGIRVIGELELAYQIVEDAAKQRTIPFLAVTGTNGKSTTTVLLDYMLKKSGSETLLGGNIGNALSEEILKKSGIRPSRLMESPGMAKLNIEKVEVVIVEVSSFQLEAIDTFRPHIASILNITPDHLDRYVSMDEYRNAKAAILSNQESTDFSVLNADDPEVMRINNETVQMKSNGPNIICFSLSKELLGVYQKDGMLYCNMPEFTAYDAHFPFVAASEIKIKGIHNLENAMAASAMALLARCPFEAVRESLREFQGLEHRLEFVRQIDGVDYYNDSKGTNVGAVMKSLSSFDGPLILIAGGRDKEGDFSLLRPMVADTVKGLVLLGEAAEKIRDSLGDLTETVMARDLREAVSMARDLSVDGDTVLLSPGCTSFDMFRDFEDRGRQYKNLVDGFDTATVSRKGLT